MKIIEIKYIRCANTSQMDFWLLEDGSGGAITPFIHKILFAIC